MAYQSYNAPYGAGAGGYPHHQQHPPYPPPHHQLHQQHHAPAPAPSPASGFRSYYADRLRQLTFNSRPLIQELSIMAMQQRDSHDWNAMGAVVEEIEAAVLRAPPPGKLPLLYLLDSISKNAGAPYTTHLLPPIMPRLYAKTYREVDGHTKSRMDEVIKLWGHTGPNGTPLYGPGIKESVESQIYGAAGGAGGVTRHQVLALLDSTLAAKRREVQYNPAAHSQLAILSQIGDVVNTQNVSSQELAQIMDQLKAMGGAGAGAGAGAGGPPQPAIRHPQPHQGMVDHYRPPFPPTNHNGHNGHSPAPSALPPFPPSMGRETYRSTPPLGGYPSSSLPTPQQQPQSSTPQPPAAPLPLDVAKLLQTINAGSLSQNRTPEPQNPMQAYEDLIINMNVQLTIADMNVPRSLPTAQLPERCRTCGIRMPDNEEKMKAHMDWHFRRNRKEREGQGRGAHRKWLPKAEEWANDAPQAGPSTAAGGRDGTPSSGAGPKLTQAKLQQLRKRWVRVPADPIKKGQPCPVCKEAFKPEWDEQEEEWVYRNAIDINGTIYHATCRAEQMSLSKLMKEEAKRSSTRSASPSKVTAAPNVSAQAQESKAEKRKPEDGGDEDESAGKRAKVDAEGSAPMPPPVQDQDRDVKPDITVTEADTADDEYQVPPAEPSSDEVNVSETEATITTAMPEVPAVVDEVVVKQE